MLLFLAFLAVPYMVRRGFGLRPMTGSDLLGFSVKNISSRAGPLAAQHGPTALNMAKSQAFPSQARPSPAGAPPAMAYAALGPAGVLATPQGKAGVAKGLVMLKKASKGDKKSKKKIQTIKKKAAKGDPQARNQLAVLSTAAEVEQEVSEADEEDFDEMDDEGDDEISGAYDWL